MNMPYYQGGQGGREGGREGGADEEMGWNPTDPPSVRYPRLASSSSSSSSSSTTTTTTTFFPPYQTEEEGEGGREGGGGWGGAQALLDLDVDSMNYDELLLLGELIGPAKTAGLSQMQVESLPSHFWREGGRDGGREEEEGSLMCVVCLCMVEEGEVVKVLSRCGHQFHSTGCVDVWLRLHNSCPVCKAVVVVGGREGGLAGW